MRFAPCLACVLFLALHVSAYGADKGWVEVRTAHFRVISDGTEKECREVAGQFEQMRAAFATALPGLRLDPPVPLLILAVSDEGSLKTLAPEMWKSKALKPGGFFASGSEKAIAVVRLDVIQR